MTAKEARQVSTFNRPARVASYLDAIYAAVRQAARGGLYEAAIPPVAFDPAEAGDRTAALVRQALEADGYEVTEGPDGLVLRWSR